MNESPLGSASTVLPRGLSAVFLALCLLSVAALLLWPLMLGPLQDMCVATDLLPARRCETGPNKLLSSVAVIAAFPAVLMLERFWPADKAQKHYSSALLVDFLWFCFTPVFLILFIAPIEEGLRWLQNYLGWQGVVSMQALPFAVQFIIVVLLSDFVMYVAHVVRHKSSVVWEFHKIHHAQEHLNYFSASRIHPVDGLTINLVRAVPFTLLDPNLAVPAFVASKIITRIYAMYTHSNIRFNMGPLKYVLVTPQSHRIHHSDRLEHKDQNYGNMFSIWDFMFGTQCLDFEVYPSTGVEDKTVPVPARASIPSALAAFGRMLVSPFASLHRRRMPVLKRQSY